MNLYNNYPVYSFVIDSPVNLTPETTIQYNSNLQEYNVKLSENNTNSLTAIMYRLWLPLVYWEKLHDSQELQKINNITHILKIYNNHDELQHDKNTALKIKNSFSMDETHDLPFPFEFTENSLYIINKIIHGKHNYPPIDEYLDFLKKSNTNDNSN
jgi:hypothetical protein